MLAIASAERDWFRCFATLAFSARRPARTGPPVFVRLVHLLSNKQNPCYTIEVAGAVTEQLDRFNLDHLPPPAEMDVLLFTRAVAADFMSHLSRTPQLMRYLFANYQLREPPGNGYCLLQAATRSRELVELPLKNLAGQSHAFSGRTSEGLRISLAETDFRASDVFALRLSASRTPTYGIGKTGRFVVVFILEDGNTLRWAIPLAADGREHEILVTPTSTDDLRWLSIFHPRRAWRARERVVALALGWVPLDWLSRAPERIEVHSVSILRNAPDQVIETRSSDPGIDAARNWFFDPASF